MHDMRSTQQMRELWAPHGDSHNTLKFTFWNGVYVRGDKRMLGALDALDAILRRYRYQPKQPETWGYNNRSITGGSRPSLHAYGIAFDINSRANPYGSKLVSDMPRAMVEEIEAIRTVGGLRVWRWGGDWNDNNKADDDSHDAMHFECQASPAELAAGIAGSTAPAVIPEPEPQESEVATALQYGDDLDVFTVDGPDLITRYFQPATGKWTRLQLAAGTCKPGAEPAVVRDYKGEKGRLDVFTEGDPGGVVHAWYSGGLWHNEVLT